MNSDYLIVGSGIAGLSFALRVAGHGSVVVVTKKRDVDSATNMAQGGIAAVLAAEDSVDDHIRDTLQAGDGLCDRLAVRRVIESGGERVRDLIDYGVSFVRDESGYLSLGKEGGHSCRRVAHAYDLTGREIERALLERVRSHHNIVMVENTMVVDLLIGWCKGKRHCAGAITLSEGGGISNCYAPVTVLCTGGAGKVYLYTSNPDIATGDGVSVAYRAGAKVANMEFVQFHPTCLYHPRAKNFLISEAVRGEGAVLTTADGNRFMSAYDDRLELATRDTVARSIDQEMKERGDECVYLDISHRPSSFVMERFPTIYQKCKDYGIDITVDPIPVVPAAHYLCGGVLVDEWGVTTVPGLLALGEVACTGLHGANRLASNSLLEAVVYAERAAQWCLNHPGYGKQVENIDTGNIYETSGSALRLKEGVLISHNWDTIRRTMWNYVGIVRSLRRLELAKKRIGDVAVEVKELCRKHVISKEMIELRNILWVSLMIVESAIRRRESRGLHYCVDFQQKKESERKWTVMSIPNPNEHDLGDFVIERYQLSE